MWPANSSDLNPVDYKVWGWMQDRVYQQPVADIDELREHLLQDWASPHATEHHRQGDQ